MSVHTVSTGEWHKKYIYRISIIIFLTYIFTFVCNINTLSTVKSNILLVHFFHKKFYRYGTPFLQWGTIFENFVFLQFGSSYVLFHKILDHSTENFHVECFRRKRLITDRIFIIKSFQGCHFFDNLTFLI